MAISLIDAIRSGNVTLAWKLIAQRKFTCINSQTARNDGTALYWACCLGYLEIAKTLLENGANSNVLTSWKSSPLHAACDNNHFNIAKLLIKYDADVNEQTSSGDTPCHLAAYRGYSQIVQLLVENGACLQIVNNKSRTALDESKNRGHSDIVRYLTAVYDIRGEEVKFGFSLTGMDWETSICKSIQTIHLSDKGNNNFLWSEPSDFSQSLSPENNLSLISQSEQSAKLTFRNL